MIEQRDDFTIRATPAEAAARLEQGLGGTRATITRAEPERIVLRLTPGWTRNPGVVVVLLAPVDEGRLEVVLHGKTRGRSATQRQYLIADLQQIRAALETRAQSVG